MIKEFEKKQPVPAVTESGIDSRNDPHSSLRAVCRTRDGRRPRR